MPNHGNRHKRAKPPWRRPTKKKRIVFAEDEPVSPGVLARHIKEAAEIQVLSGRIGTPVDEKLERSIGQGEVG